MTDWREDRLAACVRGENPTLMARMKSGFAVIGDLQFLPGYCVLLRYPQAASLNELSLADRAQYLLDTTLIGDAIQQVCQPLRLNYSTLMNLDLYLHTHIQARYAWEPEEYRVGPTWLYPKEHRQRSDSLYSEERFGDLKRRITQALKDRMREAYGEAQAGE